MPSPSLDGVAIVTGAGGGIGAAVARSLAAAGMSLVLADRDRSALEAVAASLPPSVTVITGVGDVGDPTHHAALVTAAEDLGGVTVSVQNAGVALTGLSWEVPLEQWELQVRTNYWGVVHGVRAALPPMVRRGLGHVLAVASGAGLVATPGLAPYVSSKHAVVGLMESVRHELARAAPGVRASVVCPGNIATPINANSLAVADAAGAADVAACEGGVGRRVDRSGGPSDRRDGPPGGGLRRRAADGGRRDRRGGEHRPVLGAAPARGRARRPRPGAAHRRRPPPRRPPDIGVLTHNPCHNPDFRNPAGRPGRQVRRSTRRRPRPGCHPAAGPRGRRHRPGGSRRRRRSPGCRRPTRPSR